jgi:hypothetical protein
LACNNDSHEISGTAGDSSRAANKNADTSSEDQELDDIVKEYIKQYQNPLTVDSVLVIGNDSFRINFRHYCLMDSAINVPGKYTEVYGLPNFITHNFVSSVKVEKNGTGILDTMIYKKDFNRFIDDNLKQYGVLLYPVLKLGNGIIQINYSISIPLTDVGTGVSARISKEGILSFSSQ